ncbi:apolipo L3-like protein [Labeo rohita]|uniref:Apolipo L3-like protein n=1 Tax=Labeo rohita TaxID=84645 RepID=A0A498P0K1_LABRO|nr:apolipo L3-like protein [Labeo rohita]
MHKKNTGGSLAGAVLGAAGGITTITGLFLAPFTLGASLALTGAGAAVGIAGGATSATCTTNMVEAKNLHETIEEIINDVQNTISAMIKQMREIYNNIEEIEQLEETMEKESVTTARGATDTSELQNKIGKVSALVVKEMSVFMQAAYVAFAAKDAADTAFVAIHAAQLEERASFKSILSAVVSDVVSVVQHATELSEINQSADKRNQENIKSDTLKFIYQVRQKAAVFQKTLDNIESLRKSINQEINKMLQSSRSSQDKPRGGIIKKKKD